MDTNVLVSFLTDRHREQQRLAGELFTAASSGESSLWLHQMVLSETVYVLLNVYQLEPTRVADYLERLYAMPGIEPLDDLSWSTLLDLWPNAIPDFADAALAAVALRNRGLRIATFDQRLMRQLSKLDVPTYW